jgi:CPA1 family monovalent cation:H+ antiporter
MIPILTWGGLRGGLAVAMALSLPAGMDHDTFVAITYGIVVFSIIVQGTTINRLVTRYVAAVAEGKGVVAVPQM